MKEKIEEANLEIVNFVRQTTHAITIISESTKGLERTTQAIQESLNSQQVSNATSFENINGKMNGLLTMFKYVIVPLVTGILALVGIKMVFQL